MGEIIAIHSPRRGFGRVGEAFDITSRFAHAKFEGLRERGV